MSESEVHTRTLACPLCRRTEGRPPTTAYGPAVLTHSTIPGPTGKDGNMKNRILEILSNKSRSKGLNAMEKYINCTTKSHSLKKKSYQNLHFKIASTNDYIREGVKIIIALFQRSFCISIE